jgi:hypothetical protein
LVLVVLLAQLIQLVAVVLWERVQEILVALVLEHPPLRLQTQVVVVVVVVPIMVTYIPLLAVLVVQVTHELCIGVNNGTTLRIS